MRKKAALIFLIKIVRLAFAVINLSLSAKYFGVSLERDVWILALNCIVIFDIAIWGPINETFRAKFLFLKEEEGGQSALKKTQSLFLFTNVVTILLVAVLVIFPQGIAGLIAPDFQGSKLIGLILMIRLVAPSFLLNQVTQLLISILNAYDSFVIPELTGLVTQILTLALVILLAPSIGIFTLAIAYYVGLLLLLIFLIIQLKRFKIQLFKNFDFFVWNDFKPFIIFALPFFFPYAISQLNLIIEKSIASSFHIGSVSILDYSRKFSDIPLDVLRSVFMTLLIPILSSSFAKKERETFAAEFQKMYQFGFIVIVIIIGMLNSCPEAFVNILYQKGHISKESLSEIVQLTRLYSWTTLSIFLYLMFGSALLSSEKGKVYGVYGSIAQVLMIILNLGFSGMFNIYIFPYSLFTSHLIAACAMACYFPFKHNGILSSTIRNGMLLFIIVGIMYYLRQWMLTFQNQYLIVILNFLLLMTLLGTSVIFMKQKKRRKVSDLILRIKQSFKFDNN
jgi:putative peptidoglycan lipid II flippase